MGFAPDYRGIKELPGDSLATVLDPLDAEGHSIGDLVTGHPVRAGEDLLHTGEDTADAIASGAKKDWL